MTNAGYENLLYELGTELTRDPEIELKRLLFIYRKKIPGSPSFFVNNTNFTAAVEVGIS